MQDIISIVVPVYNVEKYLEKCVNSIINQTYKNLEIILVDDGSTDNSGKLCDELSLTDSRITVYHKENGGLSSARNFGIDRAKGEYIGFIDSDDYIDLDMYELLMRNMKSCNADISMCGSYNIYANRRDFQVKYIFHEIIDAESAIKMVLDAKFVSVTAWNKLYKKELFLGLRYELNRTAEDAFIIVKLLEKCKTVSVTNEKKYYYFHRNNSITKKPFSMSTLDVIDAYKQNLDIVAEKYPNIISSAYRRFCWSYFYSLDSLIMSDNIREYSELLESLISELKKNYKFILFDRDFNIKRKLMFISLYISPKLYKFAVGKFKNKIN